jgi:hypothetical protein
VQGLVGDTVTNAYNLGAEDHTRSEPTKRKHNGKCNQENTYHYFIQNEIALLTKNELKL